MDVHRARFIPFPTPSISCLAFTRSHDIPNSSNQTALRLALARTNGSIEIWRPVNKRWFQELVFPPAVHTAVDTLVWTQEPDEIAADGTVYVGQYRLFSVGSSANVTEWNLATGTIKRRSTGNFSEVWCIAAQPRPSKATTYEHTVPSQDLVIGCGDGTLALLKTEDNDLQFKRFLARVSGKKAKCLTVAYQKPDVVVAGFADSTIRVLDTRNGTTIRAMSLGAGLPGAPKTTLVWRLLCLPNGDIVSGDSNGELRLWDGKTLTMTQRIHGHDGDCLDLVSSSDGQSIFSCGVDGRIACYKCSVVDKGRTSWSKTTHRRVTREHGPVRALAAYDGTDLSVLVGAGTNPAPTLVPFKAFGKENFRVLPFLPQRPQVSSAPSARLLASWWDQTIHIYKIPQINSLEHLKDDHSTAQQLVAKIQLDTTEHIRSVAVSADGSLIAAATSTSVRAFQMIQNSSLESTLRIRRLKLHKDLAEGGARLLSIASDTEGLWLAAVSLEEEIRITRITPSLAKQDALEATKVSIEIESQPIHRENVGLNNYSSTIVSLAFNEDASVFVTGDVSGRLACYELTGDFDQSQGCIRQQREQASSSSSDNDSDSDDDEQETVLYGQTWRKSSRSLPQLKAAPLALTFRPAGVQNLIDSQLDGSAEPEDCKLIVITADHKLYEYDVKEGRLSDWSRQNSDTVLPAEFTTIRDRVMGAHWDPRERLWLYGSSFVCMLDISASFIQSEKDASNKRKRHLNDSSSHKRHKDSGAGGRITNGHALYGPHTAARKVEVDKVLDLEVEADVVDDDEDNIALGLTRTESTQQEGQHEAPSQPRRYWSTFKYRPILGIVPLGRGRRPSADEDDALEVVIVERPAVPMKKQK